MTTTPRLWKSPTQANTTSVGNQFDGQVVALPDGGYLVAWDDSSHTTHNPMGDSIVEQRYDAAGNKVGGEGDLNPSFSGSDSEPEITLLANGNIALAFVHTFAGDQDILVRIFNSSLGVVLNVPIEVTDTFQTFNPSITAFGDNSYLVSMTATPGSPSIIGRI